MNIGLYAHGGSANHGCEALVRSTMMALGEDCSYTVFSEKPLEDEKYGLNQFALIQSTQTPIPSKGFPLLLYKSRLKLSRNDKVYYRYLYKNFAKSDSQIDLALAIGGDNYCYSGFLERFAVQNSMWRKRHIPCGLWGCSIDPERISPSLIKDLKNYQFITARESITYQTLLEKGVNNVFLIPDSAFLLKPIEKELPIEFQENNTVGINISPLVIRQEKHSGIVMRNLRLLIDYILHETDMSVALIPHVVWKGNDDREPLQLLKDIYKENNRVCMIPDDNAMVLKGYIKRCRFLIAARTHASIAGYSSHIPTLVIGYSVKSKGIATDLFGTDNNYVIPINLILDDDIMRKSFQWLQKEEQNIINRYDTFLPEYYEGFNKIKELLNNYGR